MLVRNHVSTAHCAQKSNEWEVDETRFASLVFSIVFLSGDDRDTLITASNAVFLDSAGRKAPAAVVGFQFYRTQFYEYFKNVTNNVSRKNTPYGVICRFLCENVYFEWIFIFEFTNFFVFRDRKKCFG